MGKHPTSSSTVPDFRRGQQHSVKTHPQEQKSGKVEQKKTLLSRRLLITRAKPLFFLGHVNVPNLIIRVDSSTMDKYEKVLLIFLLCFVSSATVTGSATYPNAMSTLIQVAFDPVYWLTTFHRMDLSRQVRFRWLRLLPDLIHGRLHLRPIYR
ncbi:uncharacterized protein TNIN_327071 [Trichonephila inaurata madagascariensis]|uniref:Uncharacterized protein n=1 Tax=Trichonephila inaurata madagascariensis TaxID=2747483 RepID=A0A8X6Y2X5_9ARAC|nr:uncharacterized protein TNIN_327071 [Trichonephila inaurata madagascariensis]